MNTHSDIAQGASDLFKIPCKTVRQGFRDRWFIGGCDSKKHEDGERETEEKENLGKPLPNIGRS
jgi:hypothetical protein